MFKEQAEVLEILPPERLGAAGADGLGVANNVFVVLQQDIAGEFLALEQAVGNFVVEARDVVLVHAFLAGVLQAFGEGDEGIFLEQAENPLIENQPLIEAERGAWGRRARRLGVGAAGGMESVNSLPTQICVSGR